MEERYASYGWLILRNDCLAGSDEHDVRTGKDMTSQANKQENVGELPRVFSLPTGEKEKKKDETGGQKHP